MQRLFNYCFPTYIIKDLFCYFTPICEDAQGLFVQFLDARICTGNSISQNPHWRQHSNHYATHAGR